MPDNRSLRSGPGDLPTNPEIEDLFGLSLRQIGLSLRTHTMGTIVSYNAATKRAVVSVDILQVVKDMSAEPTPVDPNPVKTLPPVIIKDIPVYFPCSGGGQSWSTTPILPGDKGELHVQDRSLDDWLTLGAATSPTQAWTHALGDSVFHPCRLEDSSPLPTTSLAAHVIEGPLIHLGALAASPVAKGPDLLSALNAYAAAISAANSALNGLAVAWAGLPGPNQVAFAAGFAAWNTAIGVAQANLALALAGALSAKTFTE